MSGNAVTHKDFDINALAYGTEVRTNKTTGAKSVDVTTCKNSTSDEHKIRFQLGVYDGELLRAPFGVSKPAPQQENSTRRDLDLSIETDDCLDFLRRLDESNLSAAVDHSMDWFRKQLDKAVLRDRFKPIVRDSPKPEYRPTARTKIVVDAERNNTQIFRVTKETPAKEGEAARIDEYVPATMADIQKGSKVMAIVETNGLWLGANQFGMSLNVTHLIVWPARQTRGIEFFAGLGAPKVGVAEACHAMPPPTPMMMGGGVGYMAMTGGGYSNPDQDQEGAAMVE